MKSLRGPELPFKLHPCWLQGWEAHPPVQMESPLPWPWPPGWPQPQQPWTSATARESSRLWFPLGPPGSPAAWWRHQVKSVSKSKERSLIRRQVCNRSSCYMLYTQEKSSSFSPSVFTAFEVRQFGKGIGVLTAHFLVLKWILGRIQKQNLIGLLIGGLSAGPPQTIPNEVYTIHVDVSK